MIGKFLLLLLVTKPASSWLVGNVSQNQNQNDNCRPQLVQHHHQRSRRIVVENIVRLGTASIIGGVMTAVAKPVHATDDLIMYSQQTNNFAYSIGIPSDLKRTQKPVKTHLDEINFLSEGVKGYQYGITVDPVRINSLKDVSVSVSLRSQIFFSLSHL